MARQAKHVVCDEEIRTITVSTKDMKFGSWNACDAVSASGTLAMPYPLLEHENVFFHYTPTYASWMNMVEIWLGILTRKSLRGASFATTEALCGHIRKYIEAYNKTAKPFVWRKREVKGAQLKNNLRNLCN